MPNVESWDLPVTETNREEWLLTFTTDTDEQLFDDRFRQQVIYTMKEGDIQHRSLFDHAADAMLGFAVAQDAGARDMRLQHRTVKVVSTDWVDVR